MDKSKVPRFMVHGVTWHRSRRPVLIQTPLGGVHIPRFYIICSPMLVTLNSVMQGD